MLRMYLSGSNISVESQEELPKTHYHILTKYM